MIKTDYLVKGCGASAMAFVDVMLKETDATFTLVDRRDLPGGHWNDAYPFVRLHQPSASYGVPSRTLGHGRVDASGFNQGLCELASGFEVADYFHQLMRDTFLPSGRVKYFPVSEIIENDSVENKNGESANKIEIVSLLSGERLSVEVLKKTVDGTMLQTSIPLTHTRKFSVADGVSCIPPNDLNRVAPKFQRFTVLGAGKTAIDSVLWLLANGADPEHITWVRPRDTWLFNRANFQPGEQFFERGIAAMASQYEVSAVATDVRDLGTKMEAEDVWLRIDREVWPEMVHGATVTTLELEQLRRIKNVIRLGHVTRLESDRMVLQQGEVPASDSVVYIDCTARALSGNVNNRLPVFSDGHIRLQMIRQLQPTFSAALIGYIEAVIENDTEKKSLTQVTPMTDTVEDWVTMMVASMSNQAAWMNNPQIAQWITSSRLDLFGKYVAKVAEDDTVKRTIMARLQAAAMPAVQNLQRLAALSSQGA